MKRVLAILLCLLLALGTLVLIACDEKDDGTNGSGNNQNNAHVHTYKTDAEWTKDASGHWYDVTCGCVDATVRKLQHVDDNKDAICDVCKFEYDHEHTYSEDWTADCTNHWNTADCGCIIAGANLAAHKDENGDGECDTCKYVIEDLHTHYYDTAWTTDSEYHWHAALCEHGAEVADKAAHEINAAGYCVVCDQKIKEIDKTDIGTILAAAVANNYKVISGNVHYEEIVYDTPTALLNSKTDEVFFVLGTEDSYILLKNYNANGTFIGGEQQYFETLPNGEIFGIMMPIGSIDLATTQGAPEKLNGYNYTPGSILSAGYDDTSTLAQTIANFYDLMKTQADVKDIVESYDPETGKYSFSFEYLAVDATLQHPSDGSGGEGEMVYQAYVYFVDIEFSVNDDFVIDLCDFTVTSYRNWELDQDITYDPETNTYEMLDTASATIYKYSVSQTSGERTFTTIYPKASFVPADFELFLVTGTDYDEDSHLYITDEVEILDTDGDGIVDLVIDPYTFIRLHIGNVIPSSAIPSFMDDPVVTYENLNGSGTPWGSADDFQAPDFSGYMNAISFFTIDSGEYMFTITAGEVVKKVHVTITGEPAPDTSLDTPSDFHVKVTEEGAYADEYKFVATEAGIYTFNLPAGLGISSDRGMFVAPGVQYTANEEGATLVFECWAGREITYYVAAGARGWYNITVDFEAADIQKPLDPSEALTGVYDAAAGAETGVLTIDGTNKTIVFEHSKGSNSYTFTFDDGKFVLMNQYGPISSMMAAYLGILTLDENNLPATFTYDQKVYTLTLQGSEPTPNPGEDDEDTLQGSGTDSDPYVLPEAGDYVCAFPGQVDVVWYKLNITEGGYLTLSSTYGENAWFKLGTDPMHYSQNNEGNGQSVSAYFPAGSVAYIGVGEYSEKIADVDFKVEFEAKASDSFDELVGTWYGKAEGFFTIDYTLTINADGTGTLTYVSFGETNATVSYVFVDGNDVIIGYTSMNGAGSLICTYDGTTFACTQGTMMDSFVFQTTPIEDGGDVGGEDPDEPQEPETDPLKQAVCGDYPELIDGYVVYIYNNGEDYVVNVAKTNDDGEYIVDLYFTYEVTDNLDGTYTLTLTYNPVNYEKGAEFVDEILENDFVIAQKTFEEALISSDFENALNGESVSFYTDSDTGNLMANFWPSDYSYDYYYIATVVDNLDGTYTITFVVDENNLAYNPANDYFHADKTIIATYDGTSVSIAYEGEEPAPSEPAGTFDDPIALQESNTCQFPGGWGYTFYSFTPAVNGTLTITVVDNDDLSWGYGFGEYEINQVEGLTADITLTAGRTVYIGMSTYSAEAGVIEFTSTFVESTEEPTPVEPDGSAENPFSLVMGENSLVYQGYAYAWALYKYTAEEDGVLTITMITSNYDLGYGSAPMMINGSQASPLSITLSAGQTIWIGITTASGSNSATPIEFTAEFGNGEGEEVQEPVREADLVIGNNAINAENINFTYTATADIKLSLTLGNQIMGEVIVTYSINGGTAIAIANGSSVEVELKANDVLVVSAETTMGYQSITVAEVVDEPQEPGNTPAGSGTNADPYIITIPGEITFNGAHDAYIQFTAAEDGTYVLTYPSGCYVTGMPGAAIKDSANCTYTFDMTAGQTLKVNPWKTSGTGEFKYTIAKAEVVTPDPEEPGEGGEEGGATGTAETYVNGTVTIVIDKVADTLVITKGTTTYTYSYSETYNKAVDGVVAGTVYDANGGFTNVMNLTFNDDGTVKSFVWYGQTYKDFVKQ